MQNKTCQPEVSSRRTFVERAIYAIGAAITAVIGAPAVTYLLSSPKSGATGNLIEVADLASMETGKPQEVVFHRIRVDAWKKTKEKTTAWVVKTGDDSAVAFSPGCPHLGCIYRWEGETFVCPCHTSTFAPDGRVLSGPAPRGLDRYVSRVEGGKVLIGSHIEKSNA
jgi:Rieske Fe-S protein